MHEDDSPVGTIRIGKPPSGPMRRKPAYRRYLPLAVLAAVVVVVGAAAVGILVARSDFHAAAASPTHSASAPSPHPVDAAGAEACRLIKLASENDQLLDPETVAAILREAQASSSFNVRFHAQMLHNRQELALADSRDHATYVFDLQSEAYEMQTDCITEGLSD